MNRPIARLYLVIALLFAVLIAFASRWTVFESASLRNNPDNQRTVLAQQRTARGRILASNGSVIAESVRNSQGVYERRYPAGSLFANAIGYSFPTGAGQTGLERYRSAQLTGQSAGGLERLLDQLQGTSHAGDTVQSTLVPRIQCAAVAALGGREGSVVALDPRTGAVEAMASSPSYNPNLLAAPTGIKKVEAQSGNPLVNRAVQFGYAPGSTFKIVTLTAALSSGRLTPESTLSGRNGIVISGTPLHNDANESFGYITLTKALADSVNTVYAQVAVKVGKPLMAHYMKLFGFYSKPQLDYPAEEMSASGEFFNEQLTLPTSELVDVGRMGIGQDHLAVTPLQMAEVVATVANHGRLMRPHLTARIIDPEGRTVQRIAPQVQADVMRPQIASQITTMMEAVVKEGTGRGIYDPSMPIAGKTGTAETIEGQAINDAWFVCFAPANDPKVAIAATVAKVPGYGAGYALPVAKQVLEAALG